MKETIHSEGRFNFIDCGSGAPMILLHGLFGALSNFEGMVQHFQRSHRVLIPILPLTELPVKESSVVGMVDYIEEFIDYKGLEKVLLIGNSLGGHVALMYAIRKPEKVAGLVLTGSSGLFESAMGETYPKKSDYDYIKERVEFTFYDKKHATEELVDEVFEIVNNREKAIRVLYIARSAMRHNLRTQLPELNIPVQLIWGKDDQITPAFVAEEFHKLLPDSRLELIEKCGHAPMMEYPDRFNELIENFLLHLKASKV